MTGVAPSVDQWTLGMNPHGQPMDMRRTLYPGHSAMTARRFRFIDISEMPLDMERLVVMQALVETIDTWPITENTKGEYALALLAFARWADERGASLSRATVVSLLADFDGAKKNGLSALRRAAAELPDLTEEARKRLFPPPPEAVSKEDDWRFAVQGRTARRSCDFLRFVIPGDASLSARQFAEVREQRLAKIDGDHSERAEWVRALKQEFRARITAKQIADLSLIGLYSGLKKWASWIDAENRAWSRKSAVDDLAAYSRHLAHRWRAGSLSAQSTRNYSSSLVPLLASTLGTEPYKVSLKLSIPRTKESGRTTERPNPEALQRFCWNLSAIVTALPANVLCKPISSSVRAKLWTNGELNDVHLPEPYGGFGGQRFDPRIANLPLIQLRIWAEMGRFIAMTGVNLSVAEKLTVGEWRDEGDRAEVLKARAHKMIAVNTSKKYARNLGAHLEFITKCVPAETDGNTPLFPAVITNQEKANPRSVVAAARSETLNLRCDVLRIDIRRNSGVGLWLRVNGIEYFRPRALRDAKAAWLLRRYKGDSLLVSQALQNKPQTTHAHYGGKGNTEQAILDWSRLWSSPEQPAALVPGKCDLPGQHKPIGDQPAGECIEGACITCHRYRGEDDMDYIHRVLSYQQVLSYRAPGNSELAKAIDAIDHIVDDFVIMHEDRKDEVQRLRETIADNIHPRFAAMALIQSVVL